MPRGIPINGRAPEKLRFSGACAECSKPFLAKRSTKRFCSNLCAKNFAYVPSPKAPSKIVPCGHCGADVHTPNCRSKQKLRFCNVDHMIAYMQAGAHRLNCVVCNKEFFCQPCQVHMRNRRTCSLKCRSVMQTREAEERARTNPPSVGVLNRRIRYSKKMRVWRVSVFERDNYTCQGCGKRGGYLEADHIKPFAKFPEFRFDVNNGRTMCRPCHQQTDSWGNRGHGKKSQEPALAEG